MSPRGNGSGVGPAPPDDAHPVPKANGTPPCTTTRCPRPPSHETIIRTPEYAGTPAPDDADDGSHLSNYAATLWVTHRASGHELRRAVTLAPIGRRDRVLDVPWGGGFYTLALDRRLFPVGKLAAADLSDAFLDRVRGRFARYGDRTRFLGPVFVKADVTARRSLTTSPQGLSCFSHPTTAALKASGFSTLLRCPAPGM